MNDNPEIKESVTASVLEKTPGLSSEDGAGATELIKTWIDFKQQKKVRTCRASSPEHNVFREASSSTERRVNDLLAAQRLTTIPCGL